MASGQFLKGGRNIEMVRAKIAAIDHIVPKQTQTADELAQLVGRTPQWIRDNAGVHRRHVCAEDDDPAALVAQIAQPMIDELGVPDLVIHAGSMPRQLLPDSAAFIVKELGVHGVPGFTINAACLSFLVAWRTASALIAEQTHRKILICTSEFGSLGRNFAQPEAAALIGDGAAAAMIVADESEAVGIQHFAMETWPEGISLAEVRGGGVMLPPWSPQTMEEDNRFHMEGPGLLRFVLPKLWRFVHRFLQDAQVTVDDIDLLVPHQASASGLKALERLGFEQNQVVNILSDYGNCVAASLPMALSVAKQDGRLHDGSLALVLGTASGVSIGAALVRW